PENIEQPPLLPDGLHTRHDGVSLVEEELAEVGEVVRAVEVRGIAPGPRHPAAVQLDLTSKGGSTVADDAGPFGYRRATDGQALVFLEGLERDEFREHPLAANFG